MNTKEWFRAHLRWAVMVEGKEGLRCWEESIYMFLSADHTTAFQHALKIGRREESTHMEGRRGVEKRFAEVVQLDGLGSDLKETQVYRGTQKSEKPLPFHHVFKPEETAPFSVF
jgi:hypothetical protein